MKVIREGLYGNFIPLRDAVRAIGVGITVTVDEIDSRRSLNRCRDETSVETIVERASFGRMLREARSAEVLLILLSRPANSRPSWYDSASGYALPDETVGREGLLVLADWAKQMLPPATRPVGKSTSVSTDPTALIFEVPRSVQLGFDIDEFIQFLDANGVKHSLGDSLSSPPEPADAAAAAIDPSSPTVSARPPRSFRGPLAHVLGMAYKRAEDWSDYRSVFAALQTLARQKEPPSPLCGCDEGAVKWLDEESNEVKFFEPENMQSRMRAR